MIALEIVSNILLPLSSLPQIDACRVCTVDNKGILSFCDQRNLHYRQ